MALLTIQHAPLAFLVLRAGLRAVPGEAVEAARICGAGGWRVARQVVLPLVAPAIVAALGLAFVSALGNFGIPAMLGIPARYQTLPTLIWQRLSSFGPGMLPAVAALSVAVLGIAAVALAVQAVAARALAVRGVSQARKGAGGPLGRWRPAVEAAAWAVIVLVLVLPLCALVAASLVPAYGVRLTPRTVTLAAYEEVLLRQGATVRAFRNSGLLSVAAATILAGLAIPLAWLAIWRGRRAARLLSAVAGMPYALPGIVLAIAVILTFLRPLPLLGVSIYATLWIILVAYLARFFALALGPVTAGFRQADPALEEAARVAGARPGDAARDDRRADDGARGGGRRDPRLPDGVQRADRERASVVGGNRDGRRAGVQPRGRGLHHARLGDGGDDGRGDRRADGPAAGDGAAPAARRGPLGLRTSLGAARPA